MNKKIKRALIFFGGILFFLFGLGENQFSLGANVKKESLKARLIQIEDQTLSDRLRIILKMTRPVVYRSFTMPDPHRLVLDVSPCILVQGQTHKIKIPPVEWIRVSQFDKKTVRIIFAFSQPPRYHVETKAGSPYCLYADFPRIEPPSVKAPPKSQPEEFLPQITLENLKEEKANQDKILKENISLAQKPVINFDFYMINLHNVLRFIGEVGGVNIVVGEEVKEKKVTLSFKNVPWDEALNSILDANNLKKLMRGEKTILVTTSENLKKILDDENKIQMDSIKREQELLKIEEQRQNVGKIPWITKTFQIKNVDVKLVEDLIQGSIEKEKKTVRERQPIGQTITQTEITKVLGFNVNIIGVPHTNTLIAKGPERDLDYIEDLIRTIDQPISQVMIEARIVEADASFTRDLGIRWGGASSFANAYGPFAGTVRGGSAGATGTTENNYAVNLPLQSTSTAFGGLGFSFATTNLNLDARIQAMEQQGRGKTISSPKVLTLDNKEAVIKQGQSIPVTTRTELNTFSTTYKDAALRLSVTPHISSIKRMRIKVEISKNEPDFTHTDSLGNPTITTKEASTEMMVNDGDTVVIGGIIYQKETFVEDRVPGLADLPLLGWLFKSRYKTTADTELLIFITPKIVRSSLPEGFGVKN